MQMFCSALLYFSMSIAFVYTWAYQYASLSLSTRLYCKALDTLKDFKIFERLSSTPMSQLYWTCQHLTNP